jgi:outer membrane protein assembly factor BamB
MRTFCKLAGAAVLATVLIVFYLMRFQGLRIERDGSGWKPLLSFYKVNQHMTPAATESAPESKPASPNLKPFGPAYWTDFRGPHRDGRYDEMPIVAKWPPGGPRRLWRKPVGSGYASFVIANGKAFTIEQRRNQEVVASYDMASGREIWSHAWDAFFQESMGGDGPRSTPTWNGGRLYALGAAGELECLDAETGSLLWSKNILRDNGADNLQWGMAASPLVVDDKLIVLPGGPGNKSVVAYDKLTGDPLWHALDDKQAYTSPMLVTLAGERQILIVTARRAMGLTPDGKLLWEYPWNTTYDINASQPVMVGPDRFFLSAGYGHGAALVSVTKTGDTFGAATVWKNTRMKNKFTTSVFHEGHLYGLDEAILACVNAETGDLKWKGGRYGYGQVLLASGFLIVAAEDGDLALVRATPERHEELARFPAIAGKTWNHPAISSGTLLVRNGNEMSAFQLQ